jgi:hypothetical protein
MKRSPFALLTISVVIAAAGCEQGPLRYNVSGTVTYQGQPLPAGVIYFDPDGSKQNDGPQGYAFIKDGKFDTAETASGPVGGPHLVRIEGFDGKAREEFPMGQPLFADFSQSVDLPNEDTTLDLSVPAAAERATNR